MTRKLSFTTTACFPPIPTTRAIARSLYAVGARSADHQPARPYRPGLVREQRALHQRHRAAARAGPLPLPHALQPGRRAGATCGVAARGERATADPRAAWRLFASNFHLFAARRRRCGSTTCSTMCSASTSRSREDTADAYFDAIGAALQTAGVPAARAVRALRHRSDRDHRVARSIALDHHRAIRDERLEGPGVTAYRPDPVVDPEHRDFPHCARRVRRADRAGRAQLARLSRGASQRAATFFARARRHVDRSRPPDARTADLSARGVRERCSRESSRARSAPRRPSCSARRC